MNAFVLALQQPRNHLESAAQQLESLADWVLRSGQSLLPLADALAAGEQLAADSTSPSYDEPIADALLLGVLWRTYGSKVTLHPQLRGRIDPTANEVGRLFDWLAATGEYDQELTALKQWRALLSMAAPATARAVLRLLVAFAIRFESKAFPGLPSCATQVVHQAKLVRDEILSRASSRYHTAPTKEKVVPESFGTP